MRITPRTKPATSVFMSCPNLVDTGGKDRDSHCTEPRDLRALATAAAPSKFAGMSSPAVKPSRKATATSKASLQRVRRAKLARMRRAEDKADLAVAVKRCADLDSGRTRALTREEFLRGLELHH